MRLDELINEKWNDEVEVSPSEKGKYKGKSIAELKSELSKLKKTGPHNKNSPEYEKVKELQFAIRAKSNWGKVSEDEEHISEMSPSTGLSKKEKSAIVKKAKKGEDIGKKGKGFDKVVAKAKASGAKDPEAVAAAAMWKNAKR